MDARSRALTRCDRAETLKAMPPVGSCARRHASALFVVGVMLGLACEQGDDCPAGQEGCVCTSDGLCLEGLECLSGHCVDPNWTPPTGAGQGDGDDGGGTNADDEGGSFDNVAACNALVDELVCGDADLAMYIDCSLYADDPCDVADYFDCVREMVNCVDGVFDASQLMACAELGTCT